MAFITTSTVPFISAYDVYQYVDAAGLTVTVTGTYVVLRTASDNNVNYPTGYNRYFTSGSGWFGPGSGFTSSNNWYYVMTFDQDKTGIFPPTSGSGFIAPNAYFVYQTSGALPIHPFTLTFTGSGSQLYTGVFASGYSGYTGLLVASTFEAPVTGFLIPANPAFSDSVVINNLAYLSGFTDMTVSSPAPGVCNSGFFTSGYSGYGSGVMFIGKPLVGSSQLIVAQPFTQFIPTGSTNITFANGTLEVRFNRTNNYMSGGAFGNPDSNWEIGREAFAANSVGANRIFGRGTGDGTGFNTVAYGAHGFTISGGTPNQTASGFVTSNTVLQNNQWYTASVSSVGTIASIYINGVLDATGDMGPNASTFWTFHISDTASEFASFHGNPFYGIIDEIRIWDSVRSSGDIAANWNKTVSPYTGNLAYLFRN